jgi:hypothetical protein
MTEGGSRSRVAAGRRVAENKDFVILTTKITLSRFLYCTTRNIHILLVASIEIATMMNDS